MVSTLEVLNRYVNGNTLVTVYSDGTKVRESDSDSPSPKYPESLDIKITDWCDLGCHYCHESSTTNGVHADLDKLIEVLSVLPAGTEIALGGGNPLSHPNLIPFLHRVKELGLIVNLTVNQGHLKPYYSMLKQLISEDLIKGLGISITRDNFNMIRKLKELTNNIVYHVIAGVNDISVMDKLIEIGDAKVLILGYKQYGFGVDYYSESVKDCIRQWYMYLPRYLNKCLLSFDNLAIEQLNMKRLFTKEGWDTFYMGNDFTFTMYLDAVKQEYSPTSRSSNRKSFDDYTLLEYFQKYKGSEV